MRNVTIEVTGQGSSTVGKLIRNALETVGLDVQLEDTTIAPNTPPLSERAESRALITATDEMLDDGTKVMVVVGVGRARGNA